MWRLSCCRGMSSKIILCTLVPRLSLLAFLNFCAIAGSLQGIQFSQLSGNPRKLNLRNKSSCNDLRTCDWQGGVTIMVGMHTVLWVEQFWNVHPCKLDCKTFEDGLSMKLDPLKTSGYMVILVWTFYSLDLAAKVSVMPTQTSYVWLTTCIHACTQLLAILINCKKVRKVLHIIIDFPADM